MPEVMYKTSRDHKISYELCPECLGREVLKKGHLSWVLKTWRFGEEEIGYSRNNEKCRMAQMLEKHGV